MNKLIRLVLAVMIMMLSACSSVATKQVEPTVQKPDKVLRANAASKLQNIAHLTQRQKHFATEQAAKINAYRELAKQLYSEKLLGDLLVADQVIKQESFRIYLDLFLREAKLVESNSIAGQKRVALELNLTPRFYHCMSTTVARVNNCLREDDKVQFTRIGYQQAAMSTVNLSCSDCSSQLSISGFSKSKNKVDSTMLDMGLYDSEWLGNMTISAMMQYLHATRFF